MRKPTVAVLQSCLYVQQDNNAKNIINFKVLIHNSMKTLRQTINGVSITGKFID